MIDWSSPIRTECGRPARVTGQYSNGPIAVAVQFIANNGDLYELTLCSNADGKVHGGMYQLVNDALAMLSSAVDEHSPEHAIPAIDVAKASHPQPPDFETLYSGDELPPLRDVVHAVLRYMRVIRRATPLMPSVDIDGQVVARLRIESCARIDMLLAQYGETRIRVYIGAPDNPGVFMEQPRSTWG